MRVFWLPVADDWGLLASPSQEREGVKLGFGVSSNGYFLQHELWNQHRKLHR